MAKTSRSFPQWTAAVAGATFMLAGFYALVAPERFFQTVATFEPYNQHFIQDIGAFQIGIGAILLLALRKVDALAVALLGGGIGAAAHALAHIIGRDLGGTPATDIPMFSLLAAAMLIAGWKQMRSSTTRSS